MPLEVADWIKQAESRISYLTTRNEELKAENTLLRKSNKIMEARVMGQSQE
jgi:cell division protein FtsB